MVKDVEEWISRQKRTGILVTNVCDIACGGCLQLCGQWPNEELFYITIDDLDRNIRALKLGHNDIAIHGGEPPKHPDWEKILDVLLSHPEVVFTVFTKYQAFDNFENIRCRTDYKKQSSKRQYHPVLVAPIDVTPKQTSKEYYVEKAINSCIILNSWGSCSIVNNNKAYVCELASSFDRYFYNGAYGWPVEENKYPFHRTATEIKQQLCQFCYRCGWNLTSAELNTLPKQRVCDPTLVTKTNITPKLKLFKIHGEIEPKNLML